MNFSIEFSILKIIKNELLNSKLIENETQTHFFS